MQIIMAAFLSTGGSRKELVDKFQNIYGVGTDFVFSGTDLRAIVTATYEEDEVIIPHAVLLTSLTGISISSHRDVFSVRALGTSNPLGWSYGNRTIAGTLIFAQMGNYGVREIIKSHLKYEGLEYERMKRHPTRSPYSLTGVDEIPPLDFTLTFENEAGAISVMSLIGVKMLDEGESFTIDDTEWYTTVSYMAMAKTPMRPISSAHSEGSRLGVPDAQKVGGIIEGYMRKHYTFNESGWPADPYNDEIMWWDFLSMSKNRRRRV